MAFIGLTAALLGGLFANESKATETASKVDSWYDWGCPVGHACWSMQGQFVAWSTYSPGGHNTFVFHHSIAYVDEGHLHGDVSTTYLNIGYYNAHETERFRIESWELTLPPPDSGTPPYDYRWGGETSGFNYGYPSTYPIQHRSLMGFILSTSTGVYGSGENYLVFWVC
jgi:hypothetical protein